MADLLAGRGVGFLEFGRDLDRYIVRPGDDHRELPDIGDEEIVVRPVESSEYEDQEKKREEAIGHILGVTDYK